MYKYYHLRGRTRWNHIISRSQIFIFPVIFLILCASISYDNKINMIIEKNIHILVAYIIPTAAKYKFW